MNGKNTYKEVKNGYFIICVAIFNYNFIHFINYIFNENTIRNNRVISKDK